MSDLAQSELSPQVWAEWVHFKWTVEFTLSENDAEFFTCLHIDDVGIVKAFANFNGFEGAY